MTIDTSGWRKGLGAELYIPCADGSVTVLGFGETKLRDACLLAIQSLPKVTAERDELDQRCEEHRQAREQLVDERDALSARVKDLTEEIALAYQTNQDLSLSHTANLRRVMELEAMLVRFLKHHGSYIDALPGGYGVTDLKEARALIGKEPSK